MLVFLKRSNILTSLCQRNEMDKAREIYQKGVQCDAVARRLFQKLRRKELLKTICESF